MTLDKNTKVTIGSIIAGVVILAPIMITAAVQFSALKGAVQQCWTLEDQQNWADWARRNNPNLHVPEPNEIRRMKRGAARMDSRDHIGRAQ